MRLRASVILLAVTTAVTGCTLLTSCTGATPVHASAIESTTAATTASGDEVPSSAVALVQEAVDRFNATAGGPVAAQQSVLAGLVSADQATQQSACPPATVTISMDPVYARLAAAPGWSPRSGKLSGDVYAVPTLLRIYTGDRITGTDLTDLHLALDHGRVRFPAVCLR